jgi:hypothetical protein
MASAPAEVVVAVMPLEPPVVVAAASTVTVPAVLEDRGVVVAHRLSFPLEGSSQWSSGITTDRTSTAAVVFVSRIIGNHSFAAGVFIGGKWSTRAVNFISHS